MAIRVLGATTLARDLGKWQDDESGGRRRVSRPAYRALADNVRMLVADGRIPLGVALPSERDLAGVLELSRTTITSAYAVLRDEGYLISRQGSRSTVALPESGATGKLLRGTMFGGSAVGGASTDPVIDLTCASMSAPVEPMRRAYTEGLDALPAYLGGHGIEPVGLPVLRQAIAERYCRRGLPTAPEQIMVTAGAQHALVLVLGLLAAPGERVLIDHPTYTNAIEAIKRMGARPVPVAVRQETRGWDLDGIRSTARQTAAKLAYLVPDFHNPTGFCLDDEGRAELAAIARDTRMTLIIDETMADLGLDAPTPTPVAAFARGAGRADIVTIGSTSKAFWSGLRIGWIRAEAPLISALAASRSALDLGTAVVEQLAAVSMFEVEDEVLPERREQLRSQRAALLDAVATDLPDWRCTPGSGGMALWMQLPAPMSTALAATSPYHGVLLAAGPRFGLEGAFERYIRLPYARGEEELRAAVTGIAAAYRALSGGVEVERPALVI